MSVTTYYYLNNSDDDRTDLIKKLYGGLINIIEFKPWERINVFATGSVLYLEHINDLYGGTVDLTNYFNEESRNDYEKILNEICKNYALLYKKHVVIRFEKTANCNSDRIEKSVRRNGLTRDWDGFRVFLASEIRSVWFMKSFDSYVRSKRIEMAQDNGSKVGIKKGTKLVTKKSEKMKQIIINESKDFNGSLNDVELMKKTSLSRNTFYKYKRELKNRTK